MGQFSWITQDTNESIRNNTTGYKAKAYMHDDKGNIWEEKSYDGYGEFGGKDYYQLLAEMNNLPGLTGNPDEDRLLGIYANGNLKYPNLTRNKEWDYINEEPEQCPNQGWADLKE